MLPPRSFINCLLFCKLLFLSEVLINSIQSQHYQPSSSFHFLTFTSYSSFAIQSSFILLLYGQITSSFSPPCSDQSLLYLGLIHLASIPSLSYLFLFYYICMLSSPFPLHLIFMFSLIYTKLSFTHNGVSRSMLLFPHLSTNIYFLKQTILSISFLADLLILKFLHLLPNLL